MGIAGLIVTFLGFIIAVASLGMSSSVGGRMVIVLIGLVVSLVGIIGLINPAYQKKAAWRK
ncbi:MAG: hypothetical protein LAP61_21820 [Acidobacteriia bacterium]|jgi:hypothetical protein|nr:hypothetical protein [Terriglobia bacterium]